MSFTLATLKTAVQDYLQVSETTFTNQLDTFIQEAESRIFKLVQLPEQRKNVQGTASSGNRFLATPSDFCAVFAGNHQQQQQVHLSRLQAPIVFERVQSHIYNDWDA